MSDQLIGANVEELDSLAQQFDAAADDLQRISEQLGRLPRSVWIGADAKQFFGDLDSSHVPGVRGVVNALRQISAVVRRNAAAQRNTSATLDGAPAPGSASPAGTIHASSAGATGQFDRDVEMAGGVVGYGLTAVSAANDLGPKISWIGASTMGIGIGVDTAHLVQNAMDGEWSAATLDALSIASNWGGPVVSSISGLARDSYEMFVPVTSERQDAVVAWASSQYGAEEIAERYNSPIGIFNMFHDSVVEATENPRNPLTLGIKAAGDGIADAVWTVIQ